jgi:phage terminase small subunit
MLNDKQTAFVREYLLDFNATQAAIRAGYSRKTAGSQAHDLLKKPEIQACLAEFRQKAAEKTVTDTAWVRQRLREEATNCGPQASHSARIRAVELIAKMNGDFELDNTQKSDPIAEAIAAVQANNIPLAVRP